MSVDPFGFNLYYKASSATLGHETKVWNFATVSENVVTGRNCVIGSCAWIGDGTVMGDDVRIQHGVFIPRNSRIGHRVFIGPNAVLTDDAHPRVNNPAYRAQPPIIEDDVAIGAGAVLLAGVIIGKGAMIGAGAIVTHDIPAGETWVGNPARARNP